MVAAVCGVAVRHPHRKACDLQVFGGCEGEEFAFLAVAAGGGGKLGGSGPRSGGRGDEEEGSGASHRGDGWQLSGISCLAKIGHQIWPMVPFD